MGGSDAAVEAHDWAADEVREIVLNGLREAQGYDYAGEGVDEEGMDYDAMVDAVLACYFGSPSVERCPTCGQFYSARTATKHSICQQIEDERASGYRG